jgi:peptidoglycan/xylan/chitin deacetylase (PgdA/CDA1 family)
MEHTVAEIRTACGAPPLAEARRSGRLFMSWDDVRVMAAGGHDIGSHTVSHQLLSHLSAEDQARELSESKHRIEDETGRPVRAVAYPVGGHGAFDADTCRLAKQAGYRFGFSFLPGCNRFPLQDAWSLRRLAVHNPASMNAVKISAGFPSFV